MKYTPGLMVGQLSGKAGNTVASRNRSGSYMRTRTIPKKVTNPATSAVRANFTTNSQAYRGLEEPQRQAFIALGAQIVKKNSLGEAFHLTGAQAFQSLNRNLDSIGQAPIVDAPPFHSPTGLLSLSVSATHGAPGSTTVVAGANSATQNLTSTAALFVGAVVHFPGADVYRTVVTVTDATHAVFDSPVASVTAETVTWTDIPTLSLVWTPTPMPASTWLVISATSPLSAGVDRPTKSAYRQLQVVAPAGASPTNLALAYVQRFGQPAAGTKIFVSAKTINASGLAGSEAVASCTVA